MKVETSNGGRPVAFFDEDAEPCFTEAELKALGLLPVPDWARRPPRADEPNLFANE